MSLPKELNEQQKQAITFGEGSLIIVAGAGTGKTTVITRRLMWLLADRALNADRILALTFTDKAAEEMQERVESGLPYGYHDLWISTFHAFCERILQDNALEIGLPHQFRLLTETEQWLLMRQNLDRLELNYYRPLGNPTKFLQALIRHFSRLKDENISPEDYLRYAEQLQMNEEVIEMPTKVQGKTLEQKKALTEAARLMELARAYHEYQKILLENESLDFGDLIAYTLKLCVERPTILARYQNQFQYILVDEFQDTNHAQYELIKLLAEPRRNITVCLDDDQSIYKFRGASVSNVLEFKRDYPNSREIVLTANYRSPQNILDLAYNFIQNNNPDRLEYQLQHGMEKQTNFSFSLSKKLQSVHNETGLIEYLAVDTADEEARTVVKKIINYKNQNQKLTWNDFVILIRANDQADQFIPVFEHFQIPYQFIASQGLFQKPEIIDLISYLKMLDNYHEGNSLYRILTMDMFEINPIDIMHLLQYSGRKSLSLFETLRVIRTIPKISQQTIRTAETILSLIEKHTALARRSSVGQVLLSFLEDSGYFKKLTRQNDQKSLERVQLITQFYKHIEKFERGVKDRSVRNFIYELGLAQEAGEEGSLQFDIESGPEAVKIMTIHAAKGLEFSYVFVVNMVDKRFPSVHRREAIMLPEALIKETLPGGDAHLQEERRLFYVACTRAKYALTFTAARDYGGMREKRPSRFLYESKLLTPNPEHKKKAPTGKVLLMNDPIERPKSQGKTPLYQIPKKFSFTQIMAFEICPYQYRFAHILKLPSKGRPAFSFGKTMHNTLYQAFKTLDQEDSSAQGQLFESISTEKKERRITLEQLLEIYERCWIDDWYQSKKQKQTFREKGKEILKQFYELHDNGRFPKTVGLEKPFTIRMGDYFIKGVIDRMDPGSKQDTVKIIDYKTGTPPKDEKKANWKQLELYALACQEALGLRPESIHFYYLENNTMLTRKVEERELKMCREKVEDTIHKLLASDFVATPGFHCRFCDYADICEFRKR